MRHPFSGARVFLTGATGFVGAHLTDELLAQGASVSALINDFNLHGLFSQRGLLHGVRPVVGSLSDLPLLMKTIREDRIDVVMHLAAVATEGAAFENPLLAFEANIRGSYHLLEACRENRNQLRAILVASSDKAYGTSLQLPYREHFPLAGKHPYDVSKSCADLIAQSYHHTYGLPVIVGRYGNIFGAGDLNFNRLIPGTLRRLHAGEPPIVKVHRDGHFTRDFLYISDVVESYVAMLKGSENTENHGEAFNFALSGCWEVRDVVKRLQRITATEALSAKTIQAPHGEIQHQRVSNEKAVARLSWRPKYLIDEALSATAQWYFRWLDSMGTDSGSGLPYSAAVKGAV